LDRSDRPVLSFWAPLVVLGALMYAGLLAAYAVLPTFLREGSNDLRIYRAAGEQMVSGSLPYKDFFIEYPPGSLPFFVPPALFSRTDVLYDFLFANEMALILLLSLVLTTLTARRLTTPSGTFYPILVAATFALCAVLLWPVAVTRYDAVVALSLAAALPLATSGGTLRAVLAYVALGFGTAAKLVPALATLPLGLLRKRDATVGYAAFFLALGLFLLPAFAFGGGRFLASFAYHMERGIQIESVASSVLILTGGVERVTLGFGAFQVEGFAADLAKILSTPITAVLLAITLLVAWTRRKAVDDGALDVLGGAYYARYASALVLAFMLGSKVLSPQYVIWLLPLVPLSARGRSGVLLCFLFTLTAAMTSLVYPVYYDQLLALAFPGPHLLFLRNGLLIVLWVLLLVLPLEESGRKRNPA
jgi:hypothetical protein